MSNPSKAKGSLFERNGREWFRDQGLQVVHLKQAGTDDHGDLYIPNLDTILELKAHKRLNLSGYMREAKLEAENYAKANRRGQRPAFAAMVKAIGKPISQAYIITTAEEWVRVNAR